jgi:RHS repeat-associated protein
MSALDGIGNGRLTLGFKTYELSNHLGNVLTTISDNVIIEATLAKQARVLSSQDYYPFGMAMTERSYQESQETKYRYGFNGKEYENDISEGVYNFEARMMDSRICRFTSTDPLAAKYPNISSYVFVANCPLIFIDIDGKDIIGVTRQDARKFKADIHLVLADKKFEAVRALIDLNGAKFKYIDATALSTAIGGITNLSEDEKAYIDVVTNTINNVKEVHKIEYLTEATTSTEGAEAFRNHMNSVDTEAKLGDKMLVDGELKTDLVKGVGGEGLNVPTSNGSHSFITTNAEGKERSVTSGHEVFGHGIPSARKLGSSESNGNAIRADNLIRRLFKMTQRDGRNHSGYNDGHITNQEKLPITK